MSEAAHLAEALEELFTPPNLFWFNSYPTTVEGLTPEQAACAPGPRLNSVWGITLHLTICQRFAAGVLRGETMDANTFFAEGAWPPIHGPLDEAAWQQAQVNVLAANHALAESVARLDDLALEQELSLVGMKAYAYIQGHIAHNSHHLAEMVNIRHMQGLWLEKA